MVVWLIRFYRKYISQHKGYKCAAGVVHGKSCSKYVEDEVAEKGVWRTFSAYRESRCRCKTAYEELKVNKEKNRCSNVCIDCVPNVLECPDCNTTCDCDVCGGLS